MAEYITFSPDNDKLAAAVRYLTERSLNDNSFGETKLVKLLYYADCAAYQRTGHPITGANYIRMEHGPYPSDWQSIRDELHRSSVISIAPEAIPNGYQRNRWLPGTAAAPDALSDHDRQILDAQIHRFANFNATSIEAYSHQEVAWDSAQPGAHIPYELAGFRKLPPTADVSARAQRIADAIRESGYRIANDVTPRL